MGQKRGTQKTKSPARKKGPVRKAKAPATKPKRAPDKPSKLKTSKAMAPKAKTPKAAAPGRGAARPKALKPPTKKATSPKALPKKSKAAKPAKTPKPPARRAAPPKAQPKKSKAAKPAKAAAREPQTPKPKPAPRPQPKTARAPVKQAKVTPPQMMPPKTPQPEPPKPKAPEPLPKKALGQNFLVAEPYIQRILDTTRFMTGAAQGIVEVGPGRGALTAGLVASGKPYWGIELDDHLAAAISSRFPNARVTVADARTFDWCSLSRVTGLVPWLLVGNLPYNVGTEILHAALYRREVLCGALVMLQLEVAQKFCSGAHVEGYGPYAAWADPWWERRLLFQVPPGAFRPQPQVTSAVCAFSARSVPRLPSARMEAYWAFVQRAFRQRRKTLVSNLTVGEPKGKTDWGSTLERLGLLPTARPDEVPPERYVDLFVRSGG